MTQKQMTPEIRYKIFAPYIGCEVSGTRHEEPAKGYLTGLTQQYGDFDAEIQWIEGYHTAEEADFRPVSEIALSLKPLSSISDEDAVEVAKIMNGMDEAYGITAENIKEETSHAADITPCADFLRSKRYALSYMDWTVEELVEAGVYKLQNQ